MSHISEKAMKSIKDSGSKIADLLKDPAISQDTKYRVLEGFMDQTIPSTELERFWIVELIREIGRRQGREEGRREALLGIARHRLNAAAVTELEATGDLPALEARLLALLGAN